TTLLSLDLGLFSRAIVQSGAGGIAQDPADAMLVTKEMAARLGVEPTAEAFARAVKVFDGPADEVVDDPRGGDRALWDGPGRD
ncbi:MAG: carboxylesterase/lipase family protein, partial [Actinomadura sp.]